MKAKVLTLWMLLLVGGSLNVFGMEVYKEQNALKGGGCLWCSCGCKYAGGQEGPDDGHYGGSSTSDNDSANDGGWF